MAELLDIIRLEEIVEIGILIVLLAFIGGQFTKPTSQEFDKAKAIAGATLRLYAGAGIFAWGTHSISDVIVILLRASLAAGVMHGLALVLLTPASIVWKRLKRKPSLRAPQPRPAPPPSPPPRVKSEDELQRELEEAERRRKEREAKVNDAKDEVIRFYDEHPEIHDDYPPALFRTQITARFGEATPEQALAAAQDMISSMMSLITQARERRRAEEETDRQRQREAEAEEKKRQELEERRNSIERITDWYESEKAALEERLPDTLDRRNLLDALFDRYDQLLKEALREMRP